jgi:TonB family protein
VAHPENALVDGPPIVRQWVPPVYPAEALKAKIGGMVIVRIIVDEAGRVTSARPLTARDPRLGEAAVTAVRQWTFAPAIENWNLVAMSLDVPFFFDAARGDKAWKDSRPPRPAPRTAARVISAPLGDYPPTLAGRRLPGAVEFSCLVDAGGHASALRILSATHADFVPPALASFAKWKFTPGMQGDLPVRGEMRGRIEFDPVAADRAEVLATNGITAPDGTPPADRPIPESVADPVWPYELLLKGEGGTAAVEFTVQANGRVTAIKVREATQPDLGRALVAALEAWTFQAAVNNGQPVAVALLNRTEFKAVPVDETGESGDPLARLVRLTRTGAIRGGGGLDEMPVPLYRAMPIYPAELRLDGRPAGKAVIEFVIDRDGRARLPRIVSATQEEFGWAAATAVARWVFKAPLRGGQPTEVKVQIPFLFDAPAE